MKLLKGQVDVVERDGIKIEVKVIDTATQAVLSDLSMSNSIEGRIRMIGYMLKNIIQSVEIEGAKFDPKELAAKADISDPDTLTAMLNIGGMVIKSAFPSQDEEKK